MPDGARTLSPAHDPIREAPPFGVQLWVTAWFRLNRRPDIEDDPGGGEFCERLLIDPAELPALRAVLLQVWAHPHFAQDRWDVTRSWLTAEEYTPEVLAGADEPWRVARTRAAVVVEGPLWNPTVYPSGAFTVEIEYARLEELVAALGEARCGPLARRPSLSP